jgi:hypothetical protein
MGQGISEIHPFAIGLAIIPVPIIAVILMLFSKRARVNGPMFLAGWVAGIAIVSGTVYAIADANDASTDTAWSWPSGAAAGLAQLSISTADAVVALIVFVVLGSLTIAVPVVY